MATDNIVYPVRYELLRSVRGPELAIIGADGGNIMNCDSTSDVEMQHVVTRLNLASAVLAKMKAYGFIEYPEGVFDGRTAYSSWEAAIAACIDVALEH